MIRKILCAGNSGTMRRAFGQAAERTLLEMLRVNRLRKAGSNFCAEGAVGAEGGKIQKAEAGAGMSHV